MVEAAAPPPPPPLAVPLPRFAGEDSQRQAAAPFPHPLAGEGNHAQHGGGGGPASILSGSAPDRSALTSSQRRSRRLLTFRHKVARASGEGRRGSSLILTDVCRIARP